MIRRRPLEDFLVMGRSPMHLFLLFYILIINLLQGKHQSILQVKEILISQEHQTELKSKDSINELCGSCKLRLIAMDTALTAFQFVQST